MKKRRRSAWELADECIAICHNAGDSSPEKPKSSSHLVPEFTTVELNPSAIDFVQNHGSALMRNHVLSHKCLNSNDTPHSTTTKLGRGQDFRITNLVHAGHNTVSAEHYHANSAKDGATYNKSMCKSSDTVLAADPDQQLSSGCERQVFCDRTQEISDCHCQEIAAGTLSAHIVSETPSVVDAKNGPRSSASAKGRRYDVRGVHEEAEISPQVNRRLVLDLQNADDDSEKLSTSDSLDEANSTDSFSVDGDDEDSNSCRKSWRGSIPQPSSAIVASCEELVMPSIDVPGTLEIPQQEICSPVIRLSENLAHQTEVAVREWRRMASDSYVACSPSPAGNSVEAISGSDDIIDASIQSYNSHITASTGPSPVQFRSAGNQVSVKGSEGMPDKHGHSSQHSSQPVEHDNETQDDVAPADDMQSQATFDEEAVAAARKALGESPSQLDEEMGKTRFRRSDIQALLRQPVPGNEDFVHIEQERNQCDDSTGTPSEGTSTSSAPSVLDGGKRDQGSPQDTGKQSCTTSRALDPGIPCNDLNVHAVSCKPSALHLPSSSQFRIVEEARFSPMRYLSLPKNEAFGDNNDTTYNQALPKNIPLFTTGKGKPVPVHAGTVALSKPEPDSGVQQPFPMLTTGSGRPLKPITAKDFSSERNPVNEPDGGSSRSDKGSPGQRSRLNPNKDNAYPLFTNGKGKPLPQCDPNKIAHLVSDCASSYNQGHAVHVNLGSLRKVDLLDRNMRPQAALSDASNRFTSGASLMKIVSGSKNIQAPSPAANPKEMRPGDESLISKTLAVGRHGHTTEIFRTKPLWFNANSLSLNISKSSECVNSKTPETRFGGISRSDAPVVSFRKAQSPNSITPKAALFKTSLTSLSGIRSSHNARNSAWSKSSSKSLIRSGSKAFKRPRRIAPHATTPVHVVSSKINLPVFEVPFLRPCGSLLIPVDSKHGISRHKNEILQPKFRDNAGMDNDLASKLVNAKDPLPACMSFRFPKRLFGDCGFIPSALIDILKSKSEPSCDLTADYFGVDECITWIETIFPNVAVNPATRIGSAAWMRMSYSLAVWKYARLAVGSMQDTQKKACNFFSGAHVVRDILRRLDREWKQNKAMPLLKMVRRDASTFSHFVVLVTKISQGEKGRAALEISDGWHVARAVTDAALSSAVLHKKRLVVGDKIHISHASVSDTRAEQFFFGDGDELGTLLFNLSLNNVRKVPSEQHFATKLGFHIRSALYTRSTKQICQHGGIIPCIVAVIQRSYPLKFLEKLPEPEDEDQDEEGEAEQRNTRHVWRREEAEFFAQEKFLEQVQERARLQQLQLGQNNDTAGDAGISKPEDCSRSVKRQIELLINGIGDTPPDLKSRMRLNVWSPSDDVASVCKNEGKVIFVIGAKPGVKRGHLVVDSCGIRPAPLQWQQLAKSKYLLRKLTKLSGLYNSAVHEGSCFDGVFAVVLVGPVSDCRDRYVFLIDSTDSHHVLALQLTGSDSEFLPRVFCPALRSKQEQGKSGESRGACVVLVGLRDCTFNGLTLSTGIASATASIRTEFVSQRTVYRECQRNAARGIQNGRPGMEDIRATMDALQEQFSTQRALEHLECVRSTARAVLDGSKLCI